MQKKVKSFRGAETFFNELQMYGKMMTYAFLPLIVLQLSLFITWCYFSFGEYDLYILSRYFSLHFWTSFLLSMETTFKYPDAREVKATGIEILRAINPYFKQNILLPTLTKFFITCFTVYPFAYFTIRFFKRRDEEQIADKWVSGTRLFSEEDFAKSLEEGDIPLSKTIKLPHNLETHHILTIGKTGSGKTVTMNHAIEHLKERKAKAIIWDVKGDYLSKFYDPTTDLIFNIIDKRGVKWNLFNEITYPEEITAIAHSLIPDTHNVDNFFNNAGREVFRGILNSLYFANKKTNLDIWNAISSECKDINQMLKESAGGRAGFTFIQDASGKQALSVHAVLMEYTSFFEAMPDSDNSFSISRWLNDDKPGFIFVTSVVSLTVLYI